MSKDTAISVEDLLARLSTLQYLRGAAGAFPGVVRSPSLSLQDFLTWTQQYLIEPCGASSHLRHSAADDSSRLASCKEVLALDATLERHLRDVDVINRLTNEPVLLRSSCSDAILLAVVTDTIQATHAAVKLFEAWEASTKSRLNAIIKAGAHSMPNAPTSLSDLTTNILARVGDEPKALLSLAHIPLGQTRGGSLALASLLDGGANTITALDLSHMCISDDLLVEEFLKTLRALNQLQVLDLSRNLLSDSSVQPFVETLRARAPAGDTALWFKSLLEIRVGGNAFLTPAAETQLAQAVELATRRRRESEGGLLQLVLVVEGVGMEAFIGGAALSGIPQSVVAPHPTSTSSNPTLLVGSSFASVVVVAAALGLGQQLVEGFFYEVASNVFGRKVNGYNHTDSMLSATRWVRSWYTGGHYYSAEAFKLCLEGLFGRETLNKPFVGFTRTAHVMLVCMVAESGEPCIFRSYPTGVENGGDDTQPKGRADLGPSVTVLEALLACCATPGMFAPLAVQVKGTGNNGPVQRRLADTMQTPLLLAAEEGLRLVSNLACLSIRVVVPERQTERQVAGNPDQSTPWYDWNQTSTARTSPLVVEVISHLCRGAHNRESTASANLSGLSYLSSFLEAPGASPSSRMWLPPSYKLPPEVDARSTYARACVATLLRLPSYTSTRILPVLAPRVGIPKPIDVDESTSQKLADTEVRCSPDGFASFLMR